MSQYEMEAALNALQKRGFLFPEATALTDARERPKTLFIPQELGEILQNFLWDEEKDIYDTFSLRGYISKFPMNFLEGGINPVFKKHYGPVENLDELMSRLVREDEVFHRIGRIGDDGLKKVFEKAVYEFGGVLSKATYEKINDGYPEWDRRAWKKVLEENLLGTVRHLSLGEYGLNHFDDTLVVFHEVVDVCMTAESHMDPSRLTDVLSLGVDLISDISHFISFVNHNKIRLTLSGRIYKTAVKKIRGNFILNKKKQIEDLDIFEYIYSFCLGNRMIQRKGDRNLSLTVKGKAWDHQPLERKLFRLISSAGEEWEQGEDPFHLPYLKKLFMKHMQDIDVNAWYDVMYLPFKCRNQYLASLDKENIRDAFQNRYQYTQSTGMRDIVQLSHSLFMWIRNRFFLMGLVDLGSSEGKTTAIRMNMLGAKGFGVSPPPSAEGTQNPLIINPDFEVILFQEGDSYDLITQIDKFAKRIKSDNTYHFKITKSSVEKAVAKGMSSSQILTVLSENSRVGIPQNVIYSIKEWAGKVKFVSLQQATLLRGRNREVVDRIFQAGIVKSTIVERLSPTVLVINTDSGVKDLKEAMEKLGIFMECEGLKEGG